MTKTTINKENNAKKAHTFYINLADYLRPAFLGIDDDIVQSLSRASYQYFRFLLILDCIFDGDEKLEPVRLFEQIQSYEEAVKTLCSLYPPNQPNGITFWERFNESKLKYMHTVLFERKISNAKTDIDRSIFLKIATGKSAVCYTIVDALAILANDFRHEEELKNCLKYIHIGFQYLDDLDDFKKDIQSGQHTFITTRLKEALAQSSIEFDQENTLNYNYLFITRTAQFNIEQAIEYYSKALKTASQYKLEGLIGYLNNEKEQCRHRLEEINLLLQKAEHKSVRSEEKATIRFDDAEALIKARQLSLRFLEQKQDQEGGLSDFLTKAGFGKIWVSAYVGWLLAEIDSQHPVVSRLTEYFDKNLVQSGSFNETIFADGDSSNFLAGFNHYTNRAINIMGWMDFFDKGGWRTYNNKPSLLAFLNITNPNADVSGWTSPQTCVSAAASYISKSIQDMKDVAQQSLKYLSKKQKEDGSWASYWWTSPIYSTSFAILALNRINDEAANRGCKWLVCDKGSQPFWINPQTNNPSPFYTALATKALFFADRYTYNEIIYKAISWLLHEQYMDGSWFSDRILQIPPTFVHHPEKEILNWKPANFGTGVIVDDHNRIFTTATVFNLLAHYQKVYVA